MGSSMEGVPAADVEGGGGAGVDGRGEAGTEHTVSGVAEGSDFAGGGIVDGDVGKGFSGGEGGGSGGGVDDDAAVGEMGEAHGDEGSSCEAGPLADLAGLSRGKRKHQDGYRRTGRFSLGIKTRQAAVPRLQVCRFAFFEKQK